MMRKNFLKDKNVKIYISGHGGLVGSSIFRALEREGFSNIIGKRSSELDLRNSRDVEDFFKSERPELVFSAAAKVGGIKANMAYPADFIFDNLQIQNNLIHFSWKYGVKKLLFLGSACIYPKDSKQPIKEEYFLTGMFEPTNQPYAIAKTAGIGMCQAYNKQYGCNFISVMPNNLYGTGDNFHPENSHLMAALIKKFHDAKTDKMGEVVLWGTGSPRRELLYADDAAEACLILMDKYDSPEIINIGLGEDRSVREIAEIVKEVIGYEGKIVFDTTKPDGMMRRVLDIGKMKALGWEAKTDLRDGIRRSYKWFLESLAK